MASSAPPVIPESPSTTVWLSQGVTGLHVYQLESSLTQCGLLPMPPRGVYGDIVRTAVANHQRAAQVESTGVVDGDTWERLCGSRGPSLFSRSISCVSELQGGLRWDSCGVGTGGLSWGICGMDAWSGLLGAAIRQIPTDLLGTSLGAQRTLQLQQILTWDRWRRSWSGRIAVTHGARGELSVGWQTGLQRLGKLDIAPRVQLEVLHERAWRPVIEHAPAGVSERRVFEAFWRRITREHLPDLTGDVLERHGISDERPAADGSVDGPDRILALFGGRASG